MRMSKQITQETLRIEIKHLREALVDVEVGEDEEGKRDVDNFSAHKYQSATASTPFKSMKPKPILGTSHAKSPEFDTLVNLGPGSSKMNVKSPAVASTYGSGSKQRKGTPGPPLKNYN
jgi:hypothetical protein